MPLAAVQAHQAAMVVFAINDNTDPGMANAGVALSASL